jgi:mannuronan 5-epimerase
VVRQQVNATCGSGVSRDHRGLRPSHNAIATALLLLLLAGGARAEDYYNLPDDAEVETPHVPEGPVTPSARKGPRSSGAAIADLGAAAGDEDQSDGSDQDSAEDDQAQKRLAAVKEYVVTTGPTAELAMQPPVLPDLSRYSAAKALAKMSRSPRGRVSLESMMDKMSFKGFMGKREGLREWAARQTSLPKIIYIHEGFVTPADLARQLPAEYFRETSKGVYVARLPIDITPKATLYIGPEVKELRLSQDRGAFLVNEGKLLIHGTKVRAWSEGRNAPAWFKSPQEFRPFIISWAGSQLYILNSTVAHLGYTASKAYGISISQFSPGLAPVMKRPPPTGWVLDSDFYDNWYGFYTYEAEDVVVARNTYHHNIHYAIDPHDRSRRLIIANNKVSKTRDKHGIIISRDVNDSWIFGNEAYDNTLSGIVLDRQCINTVIANNKVYRNGADGITIYESPKNLLWQNVATGNFRHGLRIRNSTDIRLYGNVAVANGLAGIYGHIKDVGAGRNVRLDPYQERVSMTVVGGQLISNGSSPISVDVPLSLELYNVDLRAPARELGIKFTGIMGRYQEQVLDILMRRKAAVVIRPAEGGTAVSQAEVD